MFALTFAAVATAHTSFNLDISGKTSLSSYQGAADIQGSVELIFLDKTVEVKHDFTNLEERQCGDAKNACGMRIYESTTCDDLQEDFLFMSTTKTEDPWAVISYKRDAANNSTTSKAASPSLDVGYNATKAAGHVFVVHDTNGIAAACTVIPQLEKRVAPKFSHTEGKRAVIGVTGEATIILSPSTKLSVRFDSRSKGLVVEKSTYVVSVSEAIIDGVAVNIKKESLVSAGSAVWSLLFSADTEVESTKLTVEVLSRDCRVATTTTSTATTEEAVTTTTTTTTRKAATTITTSTSTSTTVLVGEPTRRVEAKEDTTTTESAQTTEEEEGLCEAGFICHETLKSCQARKILPAGSAGAKGNNSDAVQNSSFAILLAMITYFLL